MGRKSKEDNLEFKVCKRCASCENDCKYEFSIEIIDLYCKRYKKIKKNKKSS